MLDAEKFLSEVEPFSFLDKEEIRKIAHNLQVAYYKKGEVIFEENSKPLEYLYLLRSGSVRLEREGQLVEYIHKGESFGYPSLMTSESPNLIALAVEDSVVFLLHKKLFNKLLSEHEDIREYFTKKLTKRLQLFQTLKVGQGVEKLLEVSLENINLRSPLTLSGDSKVEDALRLMVEKDSAFVLVESGGSLGIITERDILKKVLAKGLDIRDVKLKDVATFPVIGLPVDSSLYDAMLLMTKHSIRKLVVFKEGKPVGVVEDRDIIAYESKNAVLLVKEVEKAKDVEELRYLYNLVKEHVVELVLQGVDPEKLSANISELNDRFMKRAVYITINRLGEEPLVPFSIMVLGSEGRKEQSLKTDQDNALIYQELPINDHEPREYFERFSQEYIKVLLRIGFPPCPGNVMLSNPFWRRSTAEWEREVSKWIQKPEPENLLNTAIFFDFRNVFGDSTLVQRLWNHIKMEVEKNRGFIPFLAVDAIRFSPPIGFFRDFVVEKSGEHRGEIDIKRGGIFPITQGVRAMALEMGIDERNTIERIERLREKGVFSDEYARDLKDAYRFLTSLRLHFQAKKIKEGKEPNNYINPKHLSKSQKNMLKDVFRFVKEFQELLREHYNLRYFE